MVNTQLVQLYYFLGAAISQKAKQANWGDKMLETISGELQKELKHLKGFSAQNLKKMRIFYEAYPQLLANCELANQMLQSADNETSVIGSPVANQLDTSFGSPLANQLVNDIWSLSFTNHFLIINKLIKLEERLWFIDQAVF